MPVYRLLAAFTPSAKFTQLSAAVKEAAGIALRGGGSLLGLEDRGVRRSWDRMKGKRVAEAYDQVRFVNMTAYVQHTALGEVERTLRSDPEVLRVRTVRVAETPFEMIVDEERRAEKQEISLRFIELDRMLLKGPSEAQMAGESGHPPMTKEGWEAHVNMVRGELLSDVQALRRRRFHGHKFDYTGSGISTELTKAEQRARVRELFVKVHQTGGRGPMAFGEDLYTADWGALRRMEHNLQMQWDEKVARLGLQRGGAQ